MAIGDQSMREEVGYTSTAMAAATRPHQNGVMYVANGNLTAAAKPQGANGHSEDDELTSLSWLQDVNLLKNIQVDPYTAEGEELVSTGDELPDGSQMLPTHMPYNPKVHINSKPPYSFSCLIFMAIEDSPSKALPVKDIYSWILTHFPYFQNAPTGWKNSVRHNLSLNKCFHKVDKDKGQNIGKGSLWCIDPVFRPNLLQALRKAPFFPFGRLNQLRWLSSQTVPSSESSEKPSPLAPSQSNINVPSPDLFPFLSKRLAASSAKDPEVDAAATMLALQNGPSVISSQSSEEAENEVESSSSPKIIRKKRSRLRNSPSGHPVKSRRTCNAPVITSSPSEDHTYSASLSNGSHVKDEDQLDASEEEEGSPGCSSLDGEDTIPYKEIPQDMSRSLGRRIPKDEDDSLLHEEEHVQSQKESQEPRAEEGTSESDRQSLSEEIPHLGGSRSRRKNRRVTRKHVRVKVELVPEYKNEREAVDVQEGAHALLNLAKIATSQQHMLLHGSIPCREMSGR